MSGIVNSLFRAGTVTPVSFRSTASNGAASIAPKPSGIAVDDIVCVYVHYCISGLTLTTQTGAAWNRSELVWGAHGYKSVLFWKKLVTVDVDPTKNWAFSAATYEGAQSFAYLSNGATTVTVKDTTGNGVAQSTLTLTGFVKNILSAGVATFFADRDGINVTPGLPSGFTSRSYGAVSNFFIAVADLLTGYVDSADVIWADTDDFFNSFAEAAFLVEFT